MNKGIGEAKFVTVKIVPEGYTLPSEDSIYIGSINNLSKQWFFIELEDFIDQYESNSEMTFEIQKQKHKVVNLKFLNGNY